MFSLNGCIEVFGIQAEPQPPLLLAAVNKAVDPLCRFAFFDLCYNVTVKLKSNFKSVAPWKLYCCGVWGHFSQ